MGTIRFSAKFVVLELKKCNFAILKYFNYDSENKRTYSSS